MWNQKIVTDRPIIHVKEHKDQNIQQIEDLPEKKCSLEQTRHENESFLEHETVTSSEKSVYI